jgi:hypothetical protein
VVRRARFVARAHPNRVLEDQVAVLAAQHALDVIGHALATVVHREQVAQDLGARADPAADLDQHLGKQLETQHR